MVIRYEFADGYLCYVRGKLNARERKREIAEHGKIVSETWA